jgi:hypothetical protein
MAWKTNLEIPQVYIALPELVVADNRKVSDFHATAPASSGGASLLNKVVGSLSTASTRRHRLRQQPQQSLKRLGTLDFRAARMRPPANTQETRQVVSECNWQTSRVKPVLATFESVREAPLGEQ